MRKVALITDATDAVGRSVVVGLAEAGFDIAFVWRVAEGPARRTAREVTDLGRRVLAVHADVSTADGVERVRREVEAGFGRLDLLVDGSRVAGAAAWSLPDEALRDGMVSIDLVAPLRMIRAMAPLLRASAGTVIGISDPSAFDAWAEPGHTPGSTAGLGRLTRIVARVMAPHVRVNAIASGVLPPRSDPGRDPSEIGRAEPPRDLVRTVLFLAGSRFITGEVITLDERGGRRG